MAKRKSPAQFQYQVKTEAPPRFIKAVPSFEWRQPWSTPPTQIGPKSRQWGAAHIAGTGVTEPPYRFITAVPRFEWRQPLSTPVPCRPVPKVTISPWTAVTTTTVVAMDWLLPLSDPVRLVANVARIADDGLFATPFTPPVVAVAMDWLTPLSEPVRPKTSPANQPVLAYVPPPDFITGWAAPLSEPVRAKQRAIADYAYAPLAVSEVVTIDKWFNPLADPSRIKLFNTALQRTLATEYFPDTPNANAGLWLGSFAEPLRVKSRFSTLYQFYTTEYFPDTIFTQWFTPLSEPARIDRSLTASDQSTVPYVATEIVTVDKWFDALSEPVRVKKGLNALDQSWVPFVATETITIDKWFDALSEPVRTKPALRAALQPATTYDAKLFPDPANFLEGWFAPFSNPVRFPQGLKAGLQSFYATSWVLENVTVDKWFDALSEPKRSRPALQASLQSIGSPSFEVVTVDKWFDSLSEPVRTRSALRVALQQVTTQDTVFIPNPSQYMEGWSSGLAEPVRQKLGLNTALQSAYTSGYFSFEIITVDKWYGALSEPKRSRPALLASLQTIGSPSFEVVTVDKWFDPLSEPVRTKPALLVALQQTLTQDTVFIPNPSRYEGWYGALSEPQRQKAAAQQPTTVVPLTTTEVVTVDKWFEQLSDPTRRKPEDRDRYNAENEFTAIAATMKWYAPLTEPVRLKIGLHVSQQQTFAYSLVTTTEVVTVDKWYRRFEDPVRPKHPADDRYAGENNWEAVAASMEWFAPFTEPVRFKPGLVPATRPPFFASPAVIIIPSLASWWRPLAEPPKAKVSLGTHLQRAFTQDPKLFPNPARFLEGWYNWFSEPVRHLAQLNAALQRSWTASDRRPVLATITVTMVANEINDDVALFAVKVLAGNPPATAVVSLVEIGHGASLTSIVEEGDDGSGTSVVES